MIGKIRIVLLSLLYTVPALNLEVSNLDFYGKKIRLFHENKSFYVQEYGSVLRKRVNNAFVSRDIRNVSDNDLLKFLGRYIKVRKDIDSEWIDIILDNTDSDSLINITVPFTPDTVRMLNGYLMIRKMSNNEYSIQSISRGLGGINFLKEAMRLALQVVGRDVRNKVKKSFGRDKRRRKRVIRHTTEKVRDLLGDEAAGLTYATLRDLESAAKSVIEGKHAGVIDDYYRGKKLPTQGELDAMANDTLWEIREREVKYRKQNKSLASRLVKSGIVKGLTRREVEDGLNTGKFTLSLGGPKKIMVPIGASFSSFRGNKSIHRSSNVSLSSGSDISLTGRESLNGQVRDSGFLNGGYHDNTIEWNIISEGGAPDGVLMYRGVPMDNEHLPSFREKLKKEWGSSGSGLKRKNVRSFIKNVAKRARR